MIVTNTLWILFILLMPHLQPVHMQRSENKKEAKSRSEFGSLQLYYKTKGRHNFLDDELLQEGETQNAVENLEKTEFATEEHEIQDKVNSNSEDKGNVIRKDMSQNGQVKDAPENPRIIGATATKIKEPKEVNIQYSENSADHHSSSKKLHESEKPEQEIQSGQSNPPETEKDQHKRESLVGLEPTLAEKESANPSEKPSLNPTKPKEASKEKLSGRSTSQKESNIPDFGPAKEEPSSLPPKKDAKSDDITPTFAQKTESDKSSEKGIHKQPSESNPPNSEPLQHSTSGTQQPQQAKAQSEIQQQQMAKTESEIQQQPKSPKKQYETQEPQSSKAESTLQQPKSQKKDPGMNQTPQTKPQSVIHRPPFPKIRSGTQQPRLPKATPKTQQPQLPKTRSKSGHQKAPQTKPRHQVKFKTSSSDSSRKAQKRCSCWPWPVGAAGKRPSAKKNSVNPPKTL